MSLRRKFPHSTTAVQDPGYRKEWEKVFGLKLDYVNGGDADLVTKKLLGPSPGWDYLKNEFIPKLKAKKN